MKVIQKSMAARIFLALVYVFLAVFLAAWAVFYVTGDSSVAAKIFMVIVLALASGLCVWGAFLKFCARIEYDDEKLVFYNFFKGTELKYSDIFALENKYETGQSIQRGSSQEYWVILMKDGKQHHPTVPLQSYRQEFQQFVETLKAHGVHVRTGERKNMRIENEERYSPDA